MGEEEPDGQSAKIQKLWDAFIENNQNWFMATVVFVTMVLVGNKLLGLNSPKKAKGGAAPARKPSSQKAHGPKKDAKGSQKDKAVASPASVAEATSDKPEEATENTVGHGGNDARCPRGGGDGEEGRAVGFVCIQTFLSLAVAEATSDKPKEATENTEEATEKKVVQSTGWTPYLIIAFTMFRVIMVFVNPGNLGG
ncbi:hypothetical protein T484DRAFT_1766356 [Baffinella frigidus]|nr:hypothetical protein T484DRAFT_1766356 [Cryptophyta sp. CCMP2293]